MKPDPQLIGSAVRGQEFHVLFHDIERAQVEFLVPQQEPGFSRRGEVDQELNTVGNSLITQGHGDQVLRTVGDGARGGGIRDREHAHIVRGESRIDGGEGPHDDGSGGGGLIVPDLGEAVLLRRGCLDHAVTHGGARDREHLPPERVGHQIGNRGFASFCGQHGARVIVGLKLEIEG